MELIYGFIFSNIFMRAVSTLGKEDADQKCKDFKQFAYILDSFDMYSDSCDR